MAVNDPVLFSGLMQLCVDTQTEVDRFPLVQPLSLLHVQQN